MMAVRRIPLLICVALLSAAPADNAEERMRRGNAAFERDDYATALRFYEAAESDATDPGLVAFNEAAALYRLGRYADAAQHYLCCREDAAGQRRARLLYDLGNCLVQQAGERDADLLGRAVDTYQECLHQPDASADLRQKAGDNLRVARALWQKAKVARSRSDSEDGNQQKPPDQDREDGQQRPGEQRPAELDANGSPHPTSDSADGADGATQTKEPAPGAGNLPPIPDDEKLSPMSAEQTSAYVRDAVDRIVRARKSARELRRNVARPEHRGVKDW